MRLHGSVALVTGASAGIGRSVAAALAASGADVIVHGRDPERTRAVAAAVGGVPVVADLATRDGVRSLAARATAAHGHVDVLVANAGSGWSGAFTAMTDDDLVELVNTDLVAPMLLTRALLDGMLERDRGRLCFVSSVAGHAAVAGEAAYGASKAGLSAFAESIRLEVDGSGVGVSVVVPAAVDTDFFARRGRPYGRSVPRPVPPERVARAVVRAVERDRAETWVPRWVRAAPVVRAAAPDLYRRLSARFGEPIRSAAERR